MTRYFQLLGLIGFSMGWRIFEARQQVKEPNTNKLMEFGKVVRVAIKASKAASRGLIVECDNVVEDKGNDFLFLKGSRNFGEPAPKFNPPKPKKLRAPTNTTRVATISTFIENSRIREQRLKQYA